MSQGVQQYGEDGKCKACGRTERQHKHSKKKHHLWERIACDKLASHIGYENAALARAKETVA